MSASTKLYVIRPVDFDADHSAVPKDSPWSPWYDKAFKFVVRAPSQAEARRLAANNCGDEGPGVWLDSRATRCDRLKRKGEVEIVCRDFATA